ncbi:MAG: helix-turn-helix domain-containing protein, partial [Chitinophagales bacterium]
MSIHLTHIIQNGENAAVEFKRAAVTTDSMAKEMVAFANSQGGMILIGVEDDGTITGIDKTKQNEAWVSNIARDAVIPPIQIKSSLERVGEQEILVVEVPKGKNRPYQTRNDHFYIRVGSTNRRPSLPELMRLFQQG